MDVVTSVMGSLLAKLGELLLVEYKLQKGVKEDVEFLEIEMKGVHAALTKAAKVPRDQLDQQVKIWADELTGLSYDMEDVVDNFLVYVEGFDPATNSHKLKLLVEKMSSLFTKGKARHQIANAIKDIKTHAKDLADWHDRYSKVKDTSINNTVYPCLAALYKNQKDLVGIEDARDELTKRLRPPGEGDASNQPLKIVSIVEPGGLGKTTLAKAMYDSLQTQFKCKAFVPVGRNPNVSKVLKDILLELEPSKSMGDIATLDERQLINKLRDLLQDKRFGSPTTIKFI